MAIRRLPPDVVNKIAAGEILVRPSNAVKELIENSVDAGASSISITIGNGGLQLIQIVDDGCGIASEDHALLCERFATSKLASHEQLCSGGVTTFGFRGEALASMSLVGHVSVFSKTSSQAEGLESRYLNGQLLDGFPRAAAGFADDFSSGTRILVEDLFYNNIVRSKSIKSAASEYKKIIEVVSYMALCNPGVGFNVSKKGDLNPPDLLLTPVSTTIDRIRDVFGVSEDSLISGEFSSDTADVHSDLPRPLTDLSFIVSSPFIASPPTHSVSVFKVNNRLVELPFLKKGIEDEFNAHSFVAQKIFLFLSLNLEPGSVDVNVSPSKNEVIYLNEFEVNNWIVDRVRDKFGEMNKRRKITPKPIVFECMRAVEVPSKAASGIVKVEESSVQNTLAEGPSRFKIHTCPRQDTFIAESDMSLSDEVKISGSQLNPKPVFLNFLSQRNEAFCGSHATMNFSQNTASVLPESFVNQSFQKSVNSLSATVPLLPNLLFVAEVSASSDFVLCQNGSELCVCNVVKLAEISVKMYIANSVENCLKVVRDPPELDSEGIPDWIMNFFCPNGEVRFPRLFRDIDANFFAFLKIELIENSISMSLLTAESVDALFSIMSRFLLQRELGMNKRDIWNEIIKSKKFTKIFNDSSFSTETKESPYVKPIASLKELYKEFERC